jgi:hypothetical protein
VYFPQILKATAALILAVLAVSCATPVPGDPAPLDAGGTGTVADDVVCSDPRPQVCTTIYAPVCAEHTDGDRETLASACNACADDTVSAYTTGPCEE